MAFYYLLLGHLLGDFVLQTDKIADNKLKNWQWCLLHVLIVTFCTAVLSYQFGLLLFVLVLINGAVHFTIDYYKTNITKVLHLSSLTGFLFDQSAHIALLYLISWFAVYRPNGHIIDALSAKYLVALVFITSFSAVLNQFLLAVVSPGNNGRFFEKGEKQIGILTRIFLSVIFYLSIYVSVNYLFLIILIPAILFSMYAIYKKEKWMSPRRLAIKLFLDVLMSIICILIISFI